MRTILLIVIMSMVMAGCQKTIDGEIVPHAKFSIYKINPAYQTSTFQNESKNYHHCKWESFLHNSGVPNYVSTANNYNVVFMINQESKWDIVLTVYSESGNLSDSYSKTVTIPGP